MHLLYRIMRTGSFTVAAADAVHAVGILPDWDVELADFLAGAAFGAFFRIDFEVVI